MYRNHEFHEFFHLTILSILHASYKSSSSRKHDTYEVAGLTNIFICSSTLEHTGLHDIRFKRSARPHTDLINRGR